MGHRHDRDELLAAAVEVAFDGGLSQLSFGRVARHLGIADRTVVYYFPTKDDLVGAVLGALGDRLLEVLGPVFAVRSADHAELVARAWPVLADASVDEVFALFFEANGLATAGREPYATLVPQLVEAWIAWAAATIGDSDAPDRGEAAAAIALIDGLVLVRQLAGADAADEAAARLGLL